MVTPVSQQRLHWLTFFGFLGILFALLWVNLRMTASYLLAVLMGAILCLIFYRYYEVLKSRGWHPKLAGAVVALGVALLLIGPTLAMLSVAFNQAIDGAQQLLASPRFTPERLERLIMRWEPLRSIFGGYTALKAQIVEALRNVAAMAPGVMFKVFGGVPAFLLQIALCLLSCYFFLVDGRRFLNWLRDKIPLEPEVREAIYTSFSETAVSVVVATLSAAIVQAGIIAVGFLVLGLDVVLVATGATFILAWVPLIGSTPVWAAGAIYLFVQGSIVKGVAMLAIGGVTGIADNIVRAAVLKGRGQMHPLVSLVAIFGGIQLFGILGVFIGPILAALLIAVLNIFPTVTKRLGSLRRQSSGPRD